MSFEVSQPSPNLGDFSILQGLHCKLQARDSTFRLLLAPAHATRADVISHCRAYHFSFQATSYQLHEVLPLELQHLPFVYHPSVLMCLRELNKLGFFLLFSNTGPMQTILHWTFLSISHSFERAIQLVRNLVTNSTIIQELSRVLLGILRLSYNKTISIAEASGCVAHCPRKQITQIAKRRHDPTFSWNVNASGRSKTGNISMPKAGWVPQGYELR